MVYDIVDRVDAGLPGPPGATGPAGLTSMSAHSVPYGNDASVTLAGQHADLAIPEGKPGVDGVGFQIKDIVAAQANLPTTNRVRGDRYQTSNDRHIWEWNGSKWLDLGQLGSGTPVLADPLTGNGTVNNPIGIGLGVGLFIDAHKLSVRLTDAMVAAIITQPRTAAAIRRLVGSGGGGGGTGSVTGVRITSSVNHVDVGSTITLTCEVEPVGASNQNVTWTSSNPSVASFDGGSTGLVQTLTGKSDGLATIIVTTEEGGYTASLRIGVGSVQAPEPGSVGSYVMGGSEATPSGLPDGARLLDVQSDSVSLFEQRESTYALLDALVGTVADVAPLARMISGSEPLPSNPPSGTRILQIGSTGISLYGDRSQSPSGQVLLLGSNESVPANLTDGTQVIVVGANTLTYYRMRGTTPPTTTTHTVMFDTGEGGQTLPSQQVTDGRTFTPPTPSRSGYSFAGWYTDSSYRTPFTSSTPVNSNLTLYAKWTRNTTPTPTKHTVSFNTGSGGPTVPQQQVEDGKTFTPPTPSREGYEFDGWYTDSSYKTRFTSSTPVKGNLTLYAKWTQLATGPTDITVSPTTMQGQVGQQNSSMIRVLVTPADWDGTPTLTSSDTSVASVGTLQKSGDHWSTGVQVGPGSDTNTTATLTARAGDLVAECDVTLTPVETVESVTFDPFTDDFHVGDIANIYFTVTPADWDGTPTLTAGSGLTVVGQPQSMGDGGYWTAGVRGDTVGSHTLTVTAGGRTDSMTLNVTQQSSGQDVQSIEMSLNPDYTDGDGYEVDDTISVTVTYEPSDYSGDSSINYDSSILRVSDNSGVSNGRQTFTVTCVSSGYSTLEISAGNASTQIGITVNGDTPGGGGSTTLTGLYWTTGQMQWTKGQAGTLTNFLHYTPPDYSGADPTVSYIQLVGGNPAIEKTSDGTYEYTFEVDAAADSGTWPFTATMGDRTASFNLVIS